MKSRKVVWISVTAIEIAGAILGTLSDAQRETVWNAVGSVVTENWWWFVLLSTVGIAVWDVQFGLYGLPSKLRARLSADYRASIEVSDDIEAARHVDSWISRRQAHRWLTFQSKIVRSILRISLSGSEVSRQVSVAKRKEIADHVLWLFEHENPEQCKNRRYHRSNFFGWFEQCDWQKDNWGWLR